jgi:predicted SAM-dependent methyltransferase
LVISNYLAAHSAPRLQLGAGANRLPGWLNTDAFPLSLQVVPLDVRRRFPLPSARFSHVYSEHLIEHMSRDDGQFMLRECHRVLGPGGRLRIATPDLDTLLGLHVAAKSPAQLEYIRWILDTWLPEVRECDDVVVINNAFRAWGHKFLYDEPTLRRGLTAAGFGNIERCEIQLSRHEAFRGLESHGQAVGNVEMNRFETMVLEAERVP